MSRSRTLTTSAALLLALTFVLQWLAARHHSFSLLTAQLGLLIATLGVFATGILARLFRPGPVTLHRILGAVGAYLLVGLMWALAYLALQFNIPGAVQFQTDRGGPPTLGSFIYFSFGTLTSVGYGAATAVNPVARSLVMTESLVGQFYPPILIGSLVGMAVQSRRKD
jgi:hypothetical protein